MRSHLALPKLGPLTACVLLAVLPAACAAVSTYPPVAGRPVNTPSVSPGPEVMAGAIKEAHRVTAPGTDIVFNLPAGLPENTWNRVAYLLPNSARAMDRRWRSPPDNVRPRSPTMVASPSG